MGGGWFGSGVLGFFRKISLMAIGRIIFGDNGGGVLLGWSGVCFWWYFC